MNNTLQERLVIGAIASGMLGCGIRLPDSTCLGYSFDKLCPREHLDHILHQLGETMALLASHGLIPHRLTWTFEQGQLFVITRSDGALLALATRPNAKAAKNVDQLAEEFFSLCPGD